MFAFLDLLPVIAFFAAFKFYDIYVATGVLMVSLMLVVIAQWLVKKTVSKMLLVSAALAIVLGGITIWLRDPVFLQWKPTIVYWIFAAALLAVDIISERNLMARAMDEAVPAPRSAWRKLNSAWVVIFIIMGCLNLYIAFKHDMDTWVEFKLWAAVGVTVLGFMMTMAFLYRYFPKEEADSAQD